MDGLATRRPRMTAAAIIVGAILGAPSVAYADHVVLTNGDSLTGTLTAASRTDITIDSELAGPVKLKWSAISRLTSTVPIRATPETGQKIEGVPTVADGRLSIQLGGGETAAVDFSAVRDIEVANGPAPGASWHGALNAGVDVSRGNSETSTISTNATITRLGPKDRLGFFGTFLFSGIGSGTDAVTTARTTRGGLRYDHDLAGPLYGFGFGDAENDPLQLLDLRTVVGGGPGVHVVKTDATQLNFFAGVSYAKDSYTATATTPPPTTTTTGPPVTPPGQGGTPPGQSGIHPTRGGTPPSVVRTSLSREVGEFLFGEDLTHQLSDNVNFTEGLTVFPAVADPQDYRVSFDLSLSAQVNGWLHWNLSVADRFLNIPPAGGAVQNDASVSMGLGITFGNGGNGGYTGTEGRRRPAPRKP
jgi:putative salt-induced outer membrane protein